MMSILSIFFFLERGDRADLAGVDTAVWPDRQPSPGVAVAEKHEMKRPEREMTLAGNNAQADIKETPFHRCA